MPKLLVTDRSGEEHEIEGDNGQSLMEALRAANVGEIQALCGGCCSCSTCHVYVEGGPVDQLASMTMDEDDLLDSSAYREPNSRLSCQIRLEAELEGLRVTVAPEG